MRPLHGHFFIEPLQQNSDLTLPLVDHLLYYSIQAYGGLNDLWKYSAGQWTWMSGSNMPNQAGTYGAEGLAAASNVPGARWSAVSSTDGCPTSAEMGQFETLS